VAGAAVGADIRSCRDVRAGPARGSRADKITTARHRLRKSPVVVGQPVQIEPRAQTTSIDSLALTSHRVCVRIGEPARKRAIPDLDMLHAVRNAVRRIAMDEDLTMLIGPAPDGALLEIGVLALEGDDPVIIHAMPLRPKFRRFLGREK
jgi:hypothetical protein